MKQLIFGILLYVAYPAYAYRIELSVTALPNTPVFLAGYYGDQVFVIDSVLSDASGKAVLSNKDQLCPGIYTLVAPGKVRYDILLDDGQQVSIQLDAATGAAKVTGNAQTEAYARYLDWTAEKQDNRQQVVELRKQLIGQYPNTFLAIYLAALQPVTTDHLAATENIQQMMEIYQYRRRHFFDNMSLSDVRLLHTPLYHETVQFYISKFVTQQVDTLIHLSYRMLELASGNYETFFYMSDFLIDFSLRSKIENSYKLHNFLIRNRNMLGNKAIPLLPPRSRNVNFMIQDEELLRNQLASMQLLDTHGQSFSPATIQSKYRVFYFWKPGCTRCLADISKWQAVLNKYATKSCFGIAVNTVSGVERPENQILNYEPLCVNVSIYHLPECERIFYASSYSKIIVTDMQGAIIGVFGSSAALDEFLGKL